MSNNESTNLSITPIHEEFEYNSIINDVRSDHVINSGRDKQVNFSTQAKIQSDKRQEDDDDDDLMNFLKDDSNF